MACRTCRYWTELAAEPPSFETAHQQGLCRRNPPVVLAGERHRLWPTTLWDDWCGEYEPSPSVEAD